MVKKYDVSRGGFRKGDAGRHKITSHSSRVPWASSTTITERLSTKGYFHKISFSTYAMNLDHVFLQKPAKVGR